MTENEAKLFNKLMEHNSAYYGYELSKGEIKTVSQAFEQLKQYRAIGTVDDYWKLNEMCKEYSAIGTVEGYERAIQSSIENYNLYREYKAKVQEFEQIGTVEEFKALKEKNEPKKPLNDGMRIPFSYYCPNCKEELSDDGYEPNEEYCCNCGQHILIEK